MTNSKLLTWEAELNAVTAEFKMFGVLSGAQFNFKPNHKTWSIGQIVDHLITLNSTYFPIFEGLKNGTYQVPFLGKFNWPVNFFGKLIYDSVEPTRKRKARTLPLWEPTMSSIDLNILDHFTQNQETLIRWMRELEPSLLKNVVINSPANKVIVYTLDQAFDIIVAHERRHLNQAKELLKEIPEAKG